MSSDMFKTPVTSSPHICWGVVDDHLLLFNPADRRLHVLNNTAAMVWAMADGSTDLEGLIDLLATEYGVPREEVEPDVREVTERLIESDLCNLVGEEPTWAPPSQPVDLGPPLPDLEKQHNLGPFNAMGVAVGVSVEDNFLRAELRRVLAPLADPQMNHENAVGRLVYEITDDDLGLNLRRNGEFLARGTTRPLALRALLADMNSGSIGFLKDSVVLHAAAAQIRGAVIVMPGMSKSGKSTLVTQLCERGAAYLTDEAVPIGHLGTLARTYHKSICIERGAQSTLSHLAPTGDSPARGATWDLDPRTVGAGALSDGGDVSALVFPIYRPHTPTPIFRKIDRVETMHRLIAHSFDFSASGQQAFAVLIRLANVVPAYELSHGGKNHLGLVEDLAKATETDAAA